MRQVERMLFPSTKALITAARRSLLSTFIMIALCLTDQVSVK